jgi:hypothetical protein
MLTLIKMNCSDCFDLHHSIVNNHLNCVTYFTSFNHLDSYLYTAAAEHKFYSILDHLLHLSNVLNVDNKCIAFIKSFNTSDIQNYPNILNVYYT